MLPGWDGLDNAEMLADAKVEFLAGPFQIVDVAVMVYFLLPDDLEF